ncbi:MAG: hypothetical protein OM95_11585 [Bdellovibrio sp. ArHS]|uniref:hypothetical protein n=1 Tax=Bdellovibrio sp. ArHS TaxID=1569284 RepID=UPI0005832D1E|nr:hypothetical protein [Bdellovibrio sp. ArHS]KHD87910.1 MAG: hypothetical protein OM95_11585 [Bdellovibrio sp. ArHS]
MRRIILLLTWTLSFSAFAKNKSTADFYAESEALLKKATAAANFTEKQKYLKNLQSSFQASLDQYEKENPAEAKTDEKEVSLLFSTLEPAFELLNKKSVRAKECDLKRQFVLTGDSLGRPESSPQTKTAQEALRWIDVLCKNSKN